MEKGRVKRFEEAHADIIKLVDLGVRAVAIGHILHFNLDRIVLIKKELLKHDIPTRLVIK